MKNNKELNKVLLSQIKQLSRNVSVDFGLDICKRLLPYYIEFSIRKNWGNVDLLSSAIQLCEQSVGTNVNKQLIDQLLEEIDQVTPNTEDFDDASYALNAANAIYMLLEYLLDDDQRHIVDISTCMTDTLDSKIQDDQGGLSHEQLMEHPRIIDELKRQIEFSK